MVRATNPTTVSRTNSRTPTGTEAPRDSTKLNAAANSTATSSRTSNCRCSQRMVLPREVDTTRALQPSEHRHQSWVSSATAFLAQWVGRRDHAWLLLAVQTGLRISELASLTTADLALGTGAHVHCVGKGRKERRTPLVRPTVQVLKTWLAERQGGPQDPLFPTRTGGRLSRDAIERRIGLYVKRAGRACPSLRTKVISAHTLRHTAAMRLLLAGVDVAVIALWLGHEQVSTTAIYLHADMTQKERALPQTQPLDAKPGRYHPSDAVLAFLETL